MNNDQTAQSWGDLLRLLYEIELTEHRRHRSNFAYRGVDDQSWGLETSLQRLGPHHASVEGPLLRNFVKYAGPGDIASDTLFFRLAVAQHHGLPTRALDWTTAPRIAVHFALTDEKNYDKDAAIWCIDIAEARRLLPKELSDVLVRENAFLFSIEMLGNYQYLPDFDALAREGDFILFFEPPSLDGRIVNQAAVLSVLPSPTLDLKEFLNRPGNERLYRRIIIPKEIKWEIRDKLDQDNVTERMLFPGLDGTCRWLKRYYGVGPASRGH